MNAGVHPGAVVWITGLAGAGKSTLGRALQRTLCERSHPAVLLDGDELRWALGAERSLAREDRVALAYRYARLCDLVARQGLTVVCCTISLFHEIHQWNRRNLARYFEVFLDTPMDVLRTRNQKGLYAGAVDQVVGVTLDAQLPLRPDIRVPYEPHRGVDEIAAVVAQATGLIAPE